MNKSQLHKKRTLLNTCTYTCTASGKDSVTKQNSLYILPQLINTLQFKQINAGYWLQCELNEFIAMTKYAQTYITIYSA